MGTRKREKQDRHAVCSRKDGTSFHSKRQGQNNASRLENGVRGKREKEGR